MNTKSVWTDVLVVATIVAVGTVVAGLTHSTAEPSASSYTSEPDVYPIDLPGCASVEPPEPEKFYGMGFISGGVPTYDNPDYPWLDNVKASAMSTALREALPNEVSIDRGGDSGGYSRGAALVFQPVPDIDAEVLAEYDPGTSADAAVVRDGVPGSLTVNVSRSTEGPPPCRAGWLDARETRWDGTVIDTLNTWQEFDGERSYTNVVRVYATDGSRITASASDRDVDFAATGSIPLSLDELTAIALDPGLRWSERVPIDAPPVAISCDNGSAGTAFAGALTPAKVEQINSSLDAFWSTQSGPVTLDRPLGSLQPARNGSKTACGAVRANGGVLTISLVDTSFAPPLDFETDTLLDDGSVLRQSDFTGATLQGDPIVETTLIRPSGTRIEVSAVSRADAPVDAGIVRSIALVVASVLD